MNKYNARKVTVDGHTFDSKKEAQRYGELRLLERAGEIADLKLQPQYILQPKFKKNGKTFREIKYIADFCYTTKDGRHVVEDVKGVRTEVYRLKRKMFEHQFPQLTLVEI